MSGADPALIEQVAAPGVRDMAAAARRACERYGIAADCVLHQYPLTENWTYRAEPHLGDPVVLRIYRPGGRSPAEILSELAWMSALRHELGSLVPGVVIDGSRRPRRRARL